MFIDLCLLLVAVAYMVAMYFFFVKRDKESNIAFRGKDIFFALVVIVSGYLLISFPSVSEDKVWVAILFGYLGFQAYTDLKDKGLYLLPDIAFFIVALISSVYRYATWQDSAFMLTFELKYVAITLMLFILLRILHMWGEGDSLVCINAVLLMLNAESCFNMARVYEVVLVSVVYALIGWIVLKFRREKGVKKEIPMITCLFLGLASYVVFLRIV